MVESAASIAPPLVVGLPESLGRRMRFGPFPSARHALKFAAYAAVGGAVAAAVGAIWTVPFLGAGFFLSVYQPDGRALDARLGEYAQYRWRSRPGDGSPRRSPVEPGGDGPYVTSVPGQLVAILSVRGLPVAFLPPSDARSLFESYRELLRTVDPGLLLHMGVEPVSERPFLPPRGRPETGRPEETARRGYAEMVAVLCPAAIPAPRPARPLDPARDARGPPTRAGRGAIGRRSGPARARGHEAPRGGAPPRVRADRLARGHEVMNAPARPPYPELPLDLVDATGLLGALAGVLSLTLPYFLGLTIALGALLLAASAVRRAGDAAAGRTGPTVRRRYWLGFGTSVFAWGILLAHPSFADGFTGVTLGAGGLPLWWVARRPLPYGGS